MTVDLLECGPEDSVSIGVQWMLPLFPIDPVSGLVTCSDERKSGWPLPFCLVQHVSGREDVECSNADELISIDILYDKTLPNSHVLWTKLCSDAHQRMLWQARYLDDVVLDGGARIASIDYVKVSKTMSAEPYGDDQILRKVGLYEIGLDYAKLS